MVSVLSLYSCSIHLIFILVFVTLILDILINISAFDVFFSQF